MHLHGCFWRQFYLENIPEWLLLKGTCKYIFILEMLMVTHILHFELWRHVKEERGFMDFFFVVRRKVQHTELALNFIQRQ